MTPLQILQNYFGLSKFRHSQLEIIKTILSGRDVLALLPTGSGKSLCYQIPALLLPKVTVVITPLIALMEDQVSSLTKLGIAATYFSSQLDKQEQQRRTNLVSTGRYKIIYCTPEKLQQKRFQSVLYQLGVSQLVVDEAHCISEWGHDFRPEYLQIPRILSLLKVRPVISAFTATATQKTARDTILSLKQINPKVFSLPIIRNNINLNILPCKNTTEKYIQLVRLLRKHQAGSGIIYVATRVATQDLLSMLKRIMPDNQQKITAYHGGMTFAERAKKQQGFMSGKTPILIATTAFGMGIDKTNIRFIIHFHPPANIEQYYQEIGRAGRDSQQSSAYALLLKKDLRIITHIHLKSKQANRRIQAKRKLQQLIQILYSKTCLSKSIATYFSQPLSTSTCNSCDRCSGKSLKEPLIRTLIDTKEKAYLQKLINWRTKQAKLLPYYQVATDNQLLLLALIRTNSKQVCRKLPGFGQGWLDQYWHSLQAHMIQ